MADKILIEVEIDQGQAVKNITEYRQRVIELRDAQKQLKASGEEASEEYAKNAVEIKSLNTEIRSNERLLLNAEKANRANTGSINEQRAQVAILKQQWAQLTDEERENSEEGRELSRTLRLATDDLKEMESSIGDNTRNVGNYKDALSQLPGPIGSTVSGIQSMTSATLAFIATPVGAILAAIVLALTAVSSWFKRSSEGQEQWNKILTVGEAILGTFLDVLGDVGEAIFETVTSWDTFTERMNAGYQFLKRQVWDRFLASFNLMKDGFTAGILKMRIAWNDLTGDDEEANQLRERLREVNEEIQKSADLLNEMNHEIVEVWNEATDAVKGFFEEVRKDSADAMRLAEMQNNLRRREIDFIVDRQRLENEIAEERLRAQDKENFGAEERLEAAERARDLTQRLWAEEENIRQQRLDIKRLENSINDSTLEDLEAEAELERDLLAVRKSSADAQRELLERIISTQNEINSVEINLINERKAAQEQAYQDELDRITRLGEEELLALKNRYANSLISKEEYEQELRDVELASLMVRKSIQDQFGKDAIEVSNAIADQQISNAERITEVEQEQADLRKQALNDSLDSAASAFEEHTAAYKIIKGAQAGIDTYAAANTALAAYPPPLNFIAAGATIVEGLANVANIAGIQFEKGGIFEIGGNRHSQGGTKFVGSDGSAFEAEQGEVLAVVNRNSVGMLKALSDINQMGGGRNFFGGTTSYAEAGGMIARNSIPSQESRQLSGDMGKLSEIVTNLQVVTKITDVYKVDSRLSNVNKILEF